MTVEIGARHVVACPHVHLEGRRRADGERPLQIQARFTRRARRIRESAPAAAAPAT